MGLVSSLLLIVAGVSGAVLVLPIPDPPREDLIQFHVNLLAGPAGAWAVLAATVVSLLLQIGGLYLWWPSKALPLRANRGWWRLAYDLHNLTGVISVLMMALLAATAVGRVFFRYVEVPSALWFVPRIVGRLHTAGGFPAPILVIYALGSLAFVAQAVTGALVWWRPARRARA